MDAIGTFSAAACGPPLRRICRHALLAAVLLPIPGWGGPTPPRAGPHVAAQPQVAAIDIRRTAAGRRRLAIRFSAPGADVQLLQNDGAVRLRLSHVRLPARLAGHRVMPSDTAPVRAMDTRAVEGGARIVMSVQGAVRTSAYQTGTCYVLDVSRQTADGTGSTHYSGKRVSFNFQDIQVRAALRLLARISHLNLVAADSVSGSVTLRLVDVPWDQALDVILRAKGLARRQRGNVVWIAPQQEMAHYEAVQAKARAAAEQSAPLVSAHMAVNYGKAADIAKLLASGAAHAGAGKATPHGFLSSRGSVSYDARTNTLLVSDSAEKVRQIRHLVTVLDRPVRQVLIESRIVAASSSFTHELGARWGIDARHLTASGHAIATSGNAADAAGIAAGDTELTDGGLDINLPALPPSGTASSLGLAILGTRYLVDLELSAAQSEGRTQIISSPRAVVANQQEADIRQGQEIGYVTYRNTDDSGTHGGTATVQFKDAVLELKVTPTITADNRVFLKVKVRKDALAGFVDNPGGGQVPQISTKELNTSVLIGNGQTVVLGGIHEITRNHDTARVPGLGDIPVLGRLFRHDARQDDKAELLIFVTPHILGQDGHAAVAGRDPGPDAPAHTRGT